MRVLLVDDHALMRAGIRSFLQTKDDIEIVGEAGDGVQAIEMVADLRPDVVIMDISMPKMNGIDATREINAAYPSVKVIIVTSSDAPEHVLAALDSGATGYCIKDIDDERLYAGMLAVSLGDAWMDAGVARTLARSMRHGSQQTRNEVSPASTAKRSVPGEDFALTEREIEVLRCLTEGMSNPEIASKLFVSRETVKTTVTRILEKMQVSGRTEAAAKALRNQII